MRRSLFALAVVLLAAVSVAAQEMRPVSYLAEFQLKPDSAPDWIKLVKRDAQARSTPRSSRTSAE